MSESIKYLKGKRVYVGGPIEHDNPNDNWRDSVRHKLRNVFELKVFDPAEDPKQYLREQIIHCKKNELWDELSHIMHEFVRADLGVVDRSDFVIQYLPYKVLTTGTHHEIINSNDRKKPTLIVCPQGKSCVPDWYFGFIDHNHMFGSWDSLYEYLEKVDRGHMRKNPRWWFCYNYSNLEWVK